MKVIRKIAQRYFFAGKKTSMINIITAVSVFGLAFGTGALLIILSVFNGLEDLIIGMQGRLDPDIEIYPNTGKTFEADSTWMTEIRGWPEVKASSLTLSELAMFDYDGVQVVATLKGVESTYRYVTDIDSVVRRGNFNLEEAGLKYCVVPLGLSYDLRINLYDQFTPVTIYALNPNQQSALGKPYRSAILYPGGVYASVQDADYPVVYAPLDFVERILGFEGQFSGMELKLKAGTDLNDFRKKLESNLPEAFGYRTIDDQNEATEKIIQLEKWLAFAILCLAMILVAVNLIGTLWMIVIDKKRDIAVLKSLGATDRMIQRIFIGLGLRITGSGLVIGLILAVSLYALQKFFGIIPIPDGYVVDAYPMTMRWWDIPIVSLAVVVIASLAILLPALRSANVGVQIREE